MSGAKYEFDYLIILVYLLTLWMISTRILDEASFSSYGDQTYKCDGVLTINDEMALDAFTADMVCP